MSELSKILFDIQNKYSTCTFVVTCWEKGSVENRELKEFEQMADAYAYAKQLKHRYEALEIFAKHFDTTTAKRILRNTKEQLVENINGIQNELEDEKSIINYYSVWYADCKIINDEIMLIESFDAV